MPRLPTSRGYLTLALHAHLPYVRHPEHDEFLEEDWLYEAITETYIPLLWVLEGLASEGIDFRLTLSLTPSLVSMLNDDLLRRRCARKLDLLCELSEKEVERTRHLKPFHDTARMYRDRFHAARKDYLHHWRMDLVHAFRRLQDHGSLEIITSGATHGYLPLLRVNPQAVRAQILVAVRHYRETFGRAPRGIWLPECGFYPGLDGLLKEAGLRYFFVDTHGITNASGRPALGAYAPLYCPGGAAAFGRDPESSKQVWSSREGYPGDPDYREFYRDIGFDLDFSYIRPYIHRDGIRVNTGIKYHRITGHTPEKEPYVRRRALDKAALHAGDFLAQRHRRLDGLAGRLGRPPLITATYDAELFGHWWFEGPDWIDALFRRIAAEPESLRTVTPSEYLSIHPVNQTEMPGASSWGQKGYNEVWLNGANDWVYRHLHEAADRMVELADRFPRAQGIEKRALNQAARELLLAQSSDWAFIMKSGTTVPYAVRRTKGHLLGFGELYSGLKNGLVPLGPLARMESQNNIFPGIDYRVFRTVPEEGETV
jgi:1,4-alpha-glucan branching enzyme